MACPPACVRQVIVSKRAGRLGVSCTDTPDGSPGAIVSALCEGSVAAHAGLHVGDQILNVNGIIIGGHRACIEAIDGAADRVAFVLARPTREVSLDKRDGRIGITCTTTYGGVLVSALEEGSLASQCGLFVGDTLLSVNGILAESVCHSHTTRQTHHPLRPVPVHHQQSLSCYQSFSERTARLFLPALGLAHAFSSSSECLSYLIAETNGPPLLCPLLFPLQHQQAVELIDADEPVVRLVVNATTREVTINKRCSGAPNSSVGLTVADRVDGGAGVVIIGLAAGGLAMRQLQLGDTILSVDGQLALTHADCIAAVDNSAQFFRMVLGARTDNLSDVLSSLHQSTAAPDRTSPSSVVSHEERGCEPVFNRHEPLHIINGGHGDSRF